MYLKLCTFFILTINAASSKTSFTLLLDTTPSMAYELESIKTNLRSVLNVFGNSSEIDNYILLPFDDPDVGPPIYSRTSDGLLRSLNLLTLRKGLLDCPENSIAGIEKALEVSHPESYVFLFTDASAKDDSRFSAVQNLCQRTRSKVYIFLSGSCWPSETSDGGNTNVYYRVAQACYGSVFQFESSIGYVDLRQAFKFMKEITKRDWNGAITHDNFTDFKEVTFTVDSFTTDLLIAVNGGEYPTMEIYDRNGQSPVFEKVIDTRLLLVVYWVNPEPGEYKANIRSRGFTLANIYRRSELPFYYGFSTRLPNSIRETSRAPMQGHKNYILIATKASTIEIKSLELQDMLDENDVKVLPIEENAEIKGLYVANSFFDSEKSFRISVSGHDTSARKGFTVLTKILKPQQPVGDASWTKPTTEVITPHSTTIDFGKPATVACRVTAYPKPNIWWDDETGRTLSSEDFLLEIPNVYISYVTMDNVDRNLTVYCRCNNTEGEDSQSMELYVYRPFSFEVVQSPSDETFEYGTEGKLYCEVEAYPEANIKWYHNDTSLEYSDNVEIVPEDRMLIIKAMGPTDTGEYKCEAENGVETKSLTAEVSISGLETPELDTLNTEITLKPGDWTEIECSIIKGKPTPEITWKYKSEDGYDYTDVPDGLYVDGNKLKISVVKTEHRGTYKCEAVNILGQDSKDVTVKIQFAPEIHTNYPETLIARETDHIVLRCEVNAVPAATVRWEMTQGDKIIPFDSRHSTDDTHTHRFVGLWSDSGIYHCIAENDIGRAEKTIMVNVYGPPYIQSPASSMVTVKEGRNVRFVCNVTDGNPVASTKWEFISLDSTITVLSRGNSTNFLELRNIIRENEGSYRCIAVNKVGSDSITINLKVHQ